MIGTLALSILMTQDAGTSSGPVARETVYARIGKARQMAADSVLMAALKATPADGRVQRGVERARRFSWRKAAEETVRIYDRVLEGRPRTRSETD